MAVTPPATFARISVGPAGPFGSGALVASASLADMLANHNHCYAAAAHPIGVSSYGPGLGGYALWATATPYVAGARVQHDGQAYACTADHTSGASTEPGTGASWATVWDVSGSGAWADVGLYRRPACADRRPLVARVRVTDSGSGHTLRIVDGSTTATATSTGGAEWLEIEWTPDTASAAPLVLQSSSAGLKVHSCTIRRTRLTGPLTDTAYPSGWRWAQASAESAADEPVSVEIMNRLLAGPRIIEKANLVTLCGISDAPFASRLGIKDSASESALLAGAAGDGDGPHGFGLGGASRECDAILWIAGRRRFTSLDGTVTAQFAGATRVLVFDDSGEIPAAGGAYMWQSAEIDGVQPGMHVLSLSCRNAEVWAAHVLTR